MTQNIANALKLHGYRLFRVVADDGTVIVTMAHADPIAARRAKAVVKAIVGTRVNVTVR